VKAKVLGPGKVIIYPAPITQAKDSKCVYGELGILVTFVGRGVELKTMEIVKKKKNRP